MATQVLAIVNRARGRMGLSPLSATDYDSGIEKDHLEARNNFNFAWEELTETGQVDNLKTFQITTIASTQTYTLPFETSDLANIDLRIIDAIGSDDYHLSYRMLDEVYQMYPDLSDIPEGKPGEWFISLSDTVNVRHLRFIPTPDDAYVVEGVEKVVASALSAVDLTTCSKEGDRWLEQQILVKTLKGRGINNQEETMTLQRLWNAYLLTDFKVNTDRKFPRPRQTRQYR